MTWHFVTALQLVDLLQNLVDQDWPLTHAQTNDLMGSIGWARQDDDWLYTATTGVNRSTVRASQVDATLSSLTFNVTDVDLTDSPERDAFMNDAFTGYVRALTEPWGKPKLSRGASPKAQWDLDNGCRVTIADYHECIEVGLKSPRMAGALRTLER